MVVAGSLLDERAVLVRSWKLLDAVFGWPWTRQKWKIRWRSNEDRRIKLDGKRIGLCEPSMHPCEPESMHTALTIRLTVSPFIRLTTSSRQEQILVLVGRCIVLIAAIAVVK
jgi:hypothetical protein